MRPSRHLFAFLIGLAAATFAMPTSAATQNVAPDATDATDATDTTAAASTTTLQAALNRAKPGDTVQLAAGTYTLDHTLDLRKGVTLAGVGSDTVLASAHNDEAILRIQNEQNGPLTGVRICDLTLDGRQGQNLYGVLAYGDNAPIQGLELHGLHIHHIADTRPDADAHQFGVFLTQQVTHANLTQLSIADINPQSLWAAGIRMAEGSSHTTVANSHIHRTGRGGILANANSDHLVIRNNTITHSGLAAAARRQAGDDAADNDNVARLGIELFGGSHDSVVEGNHVDRWISIDASDRVALRNNTLGPTGPQDDGGNAFAGIEIVDARNVVVCGNRIDGNNPDTPDDQCIFGIGMSFSGVETTENVLIYNNIIRNCNTFALQVQGDEGGAKHLYFRDNVFEKTTAGPHAFIPHQGHGLRLINHVSHVTFDRTVTRQHAGDAIQFCDGDAGGIQHICIAGPAAADSGNNILPVNDAAHVQVLANPGPAPQPTAFTPGQDLTLNFITPQGHPFTPTTVLWDLGDGPTLVTFSATLDAKHTENFEPGTLVSAVAFDTSQSGFAQAQSTTLRD